jgi:hypothetical protein
MTLSTIKEDEAFVVTSDLGNKSVLLYHHKAIAKIVPGYAIAWLSPSEAWFLRNNAYYDTPSRFPVGVHFLYR